MNSHDFWTKIDNRRLNSQNSQNNLGIQNQNMNITNLNSTNNNRSDDPMNQVLDDFFGDFFNNEGPTQTQTIPSSNGIQISIGNNLSHMGPHSFFHSFSSPFGINRGVFQNNYFSNFGNRLFLSDLARLIALQQRGRGRTAHPPATRDALSKLKRFPLAERFCKKTDGKMELPNCCICQCEIELGKETVLLPCGHMYHWECCLHWLKTNNTCPICRFEIK